MVENVSTSITYDPLLFSASFAIALLISLASVHLAYVLEGSGKVRYVLTGVVFGIGVWTTHYIGMEAVNGSMRMDYNVSLTAVSLLPAVFVSMFAYRELFVGFSYRGRMIRSAMLFSLAISSMHYLGMYAVELNGVTNYSAQMVILSVLIPILICGVTFSYFSKRWEGKAIRFPQKILLSVALSLAIGSMHYIAMESIEYIPHEIDKKGDGLVGESENVENIMLFVDVAIIGTLIVVLMFISSYFRFVRNKYSTENRKLEEIVKNRTEDLTQLLLANDEQMMRLAQINVRMTLLNETARNLRQADKIYQETEDEGVYYKFVIRNIQEATSAEMGALVLLDNDGRCSEIVTAGVADQIESKIGVFPTGSGMFKDYGQYDMAVRISSEEAKDKFSPVPDGHPPVRNLMLQAVTLNDSVCGIIMLANKEGGGDFSGDDEKMLSFYVAEVAQSFHINLLMQSIRQSNDDLILEKQEQQSLINRLQQAKEQLLQSEKMASIGQLAAGVAHEINNPVGYINSNISSLDQYVKDLFSILKIYELAESSISDVDLISEIERKKREYDLEFIKEDIVNLVDESLEGVTRVKQIVQDLKEFSHVGDGEWQWTDLHKCIDSTINIVNNEIKYKAKVVKDYGNLPLIECFSSQLNQVILNLLVNAAHAIEDRGIIKIKTRAEKEYVDIEISDNGKGIKKENINRIFDPFFTTKPVGKGTGLGLSLSYGIVQKHNGKIRVKSILGKGTKFAIRLPINQTQQRLAS
ncbi:MAG: ATP-binding protein [Gammaproteobacteria bacterium]|nr:ATP-binding protein [Gammaproteobacteria bacterium]